MTVTELRRSLETLEREGLGNAPVVLSADVAGTAFRALGEMSRGRDMKCLGGHLHYHPDNQTPNAVLLYPEQDHE